MSHLYFLLNSSVRANNVYSKTEKMRAFLTLGLGTILFGTFLSASWGRMQCVEMGKCENCHRDETDRDYCEETGRKVKISCHDQEGEGGAEEFETFRACLLTAKDEYFRVVIFQLAMGVIGGLAYWGVQIRKKKNMTLFERRRLI